MGGVVVLGATWWGLVFFAGDAEMPGISFVWRDEVMGEGEDFAVFYNCGGGLEISNESASGGLFDEVLDGSVGDFDVEVLWWWGVVSSVGFCLVFVDKRGFIFDLCAFRLDGGELGAEVEGAMK